MKSRPILFKTEMVKAILDGTKTMTRRVVKLPSWSTKDFNDFGFYDGYFCVIADNTGCEVELESPYGKVGDELWVRETFFKNGDKYIFLADGTCCEQFEQCECSEVGKPKWKPSIFMPREASRITLEITNIRVEKLQAITNEDAKAEGASDVLTMKDFALLKDLDWIIPRPFLEYQFGFLALWCKINGVKSWTDNPYVWVVEFKKKEVSSE